MVLEDYKELVSTSATITTIIQFLTGTTVCKQFIESRSTGESSCLPFVSKIMFDEEILKKNSTLESLRIYFS